jgi:hypothetical protein
MQNHCFTPGARKISPGAEIAGKCVEVLFSRLRHETFRPRRKQIQKIKKIKKKLKIKNCASGVGFPPEAEKAADSFFTHEA